MQGNREAEGQGLEGHLLCTVYSSVPSECYTTSKHYLLKRVKLKQIKNTVLFVPLNLFPNTAPADPSSIISC